MRKAIVTLWTLLLWALACILGGESSHSHSGEGTRSMLEQCCERAQTVQSWQMGSAKIWCLAHPDSVPCRQCLQLASCARNDAAAD